MQLGKQDTGSGLVSAAACVACAPHSAVTIPNSNQEAIQEALPRRRRTLDTTSRRPVASGSRSCAGGTHRRRSTRSGSLLVAAAMASPLAAALRPHQIRDAA